MSAAPECQRAPDVNERIIVGNSAPLNRVLKRASQVASRDVTVLIQGQSGTGKDMLASFIHGKSARASRPFVRFNSAAVPIPLAEAELFGHTRGAFTGATSARSGFVRQAHGGTLVFDEVGELPLELQAKLLRLLQDGEVQPLGASRVEHADVRILACTNRDLRALVGQGKFREDLYYRLAVVELALPALAERRQDIPLLAREFALKYSRVFRIEEVSLSAELLQRLSQREWPGNVRELENCIARMLALSTTGRLELEDLEDEPQKPCTCPPKGSLRFQVSEFERQLIERTLKDCAHNQSEAARQLEITRVTLIDKMKRHGIHPRARAAN
ncbi:MAG TPA: sigma-54 dependent transcriptional regulator [Polyangiaceae bacterium]|nr:sigma-54 dependent transcriptional regulator [Polyangiaceae bacterium]